jgi:hypothetical protein
MKEMLLMAIEILSIERLLTREFPATDSILGRSLIDRGGAVLISGPQKIGKSLFATQLALGLAGGVPFLGIAPGRANYRSLILQAEVSEKRTQERFLKQIAGFPREACAQVLNACVFSQIKLDSTEGRETVTAWVEQYRPDVLIADPLANFHTGNENEAQDMNRVTGALDEIRASGVAVVMVHHHGKGSAERSNVGHKARGSSALSGWYDSHFSLEWAEPKRTVRLKFELRHDETPEDLILKLNRDTLQFEVQADEVAQVALVIAVLRENGPMDAETVGGYCNKTRQWASDWLNRAAEQEKVVRSGNRPVMYSLPEQLLPRTTVEVATPQGPIVVSTNTAFGGGFQVEAGDEAQQLIRQ